MIAQARSKRHMPMTSAPHTLLPVSTTDDRETARRLIEEYLNWISDIAGEHYRLSFDIDAMPRSDLDDATNFYRRMGASISCKAGTARSGWAR